MKFQVGIGFVLVSFLACSSRYSSDVKAPAQIEKSFSVIESQHSELKESEPATVPYDRHYVALKKEALEKEFLLSASLIQQNEVATSSGLHGRIVAFRKVADKVYLLEATQGHVVTTDLPATLLLAEIPVLKETDDLLVLDFNRGMHNVFVQGNWYGSDYGGTAYDPNEGSTAVPVEISFIEKAQMIHNVLEIRQIVKFKFQDFVQPTYEVRYFLQPYNPNPNYTPKETSDFQHVGFFEVPPALETGSGRSHVYISRWDHTKPVVYHISANTPAEYVEAVKAGILYWNEAFGKEVVRAELAPPSVTAPDPHYNLIQWVPWDEAGFAYADALMDPRTGEVLHAQVYLTSAFAVNSKSRVPQVLRKLSEAAQKQKKQVTLSFLPSSRMCDWTWTEHSRDVNAIRSNAHSRDVNAIRSNAHSRDVNAINYNENFAQGLTELVSHHVNEATFLRLSQDYVREVVAHEVGHTLGLRHNFAGSLGTEVSLAKRDEDFKAYALRNELPGNTVYTSSVMDYNPFKEAVLSGSQLAWRKFAFPYDKVAIQWGYNLELLRDVKATKYNVEGDNANSASPLFCTDSHAGGYFTAPVYKDCLRFDSGSKPVEAELYSLVSTLSMAPAVVAETYIQAKTAMDPRDRKSFDELAINPAWLTKVIVQPFSSLVDWVLETSPRALSVERLFPLVSPLNEDEVLNKKKQWVTSQMEALGGVDQALFLLVPHDQNGSTGQISEVAAQKLAAYLEQNKHGIGYNLKSYEFSNEEVFFIQAVGKKLFKKAEEQILNNVLTVLAKGKYADWSFSDQIEARLFSVAKAIVLVQTDQVVVPDSNAKQFVYSKTTRLLATKLLGATLGVPVDWSYFSRLELKKLFNDLLEQNLGKKLTEVKKEELPRPLKTWVADQEAVLFSF